MPNEDDTNDADARSHSVEPEAPLTCTECGDPVDRTEWHPVATTTDDDGTLGVRAFCSGACRDAWRDCEG